MMRSLGLLMSLAIACTGPARAATITGRVIAADGTPARGAEVWATKRFESSPPERREGVADAEGRFAFEVDAGQWGLGALLGDQGPERGLFYVNVQANAAPKPTTLRLAAAGRLRARLVAAETGRPLAGARLVLDIGRDVATDADGRCEVSGLGRVAPHQALVLATGRESRLIAFEMAAGPTTDLELAVPRGGKAVGRVLDAAGRPIAGATVGPNTWGGSFTGHLSVRADDQGRFEFDGLPVDRVSSLIATARGHLADRQQNDLRPDPDGTPTRVEFQLAKQRPPQPGRPPNPFRPAVVPPPTRVVTGLVLGIDRKPVGARVCWALQQGPGAIEATTDAAGRFRLAGVPDVPAMVGIVPNRLDLAPEVADVDGGGDQDVLVIIPPGRVAEGVVHDDRGTPFAGVAVSPTVGVGLFLADRAATTDARGRFRMTGLPDAPTALNFGGDGMAPFYLQEAKLDAPNDVTMSALGVIAGRVVDAAGRPVRNFRVLLNVPRELRAGDPPVGNSQEFGMPGLTFTSADGSFQIRDLLPGTLLRATVLVPGHGEATIDRVVTVPSNQLAPDRVATFRLPSAHALRVRAVAAGSAEPIADARVTLVAWANLANGFQWSSQGYHGYETAVARADAGGVATFDPPPYADAVVLVQRPGFARRHVLWTDGAADLAVPLDPEGVIEGAVLDEGTGGALDGIFVMLNSPENGQLDVTPKAGDGGRFRFGELPAGTYTVTVETSFGIVHQEQIVLKAGEHAPRTYRLKLTPAVAPFGAPFPPDPPPG